MVTIQTPDEGNPLNATLAVDKLHVGWVINPIAGAAGTGGGVLMITPEDAGEIQPEALVTVNE
jgi:hypothetical protein